MFAGRLSLCSPLFPIAPSPVGINAVTFRVNKLRGGARLGVVPADETTTATRAHRAVHCAYESNGLFSTYDAGDAVAVELTRHNARVTFRKNGRTVFSDSALLYLVYHFVFAAYKDGDSVTIEAF